MHKERKSRAKKSSSGRGVATGAGRPKVDDPRRTWHLMLSLAEREACDQLSAKQGLGFSPWARFVLLASVAEAVAHGNLLPCSVGRTFLMMARAICRELRDLPKEKRLVVVEQLTRAFTAGDEDLLAGVGIHWRS